MLCVCLHLCFFTLTSRPEFLRSDKQLLSKGFVSFCASSADMKRTQQPFSALPVTFSLFLSLILLTMFTSKQLWWLQRDPAAWTETHDLLLHKFLFMFTNIRVISNFILSIHEQDLTLINLAHLYTNMLGFLCSGTSSHLKLLRFSWNCTCTLLVQNFSPINLNAHQH